MSADLVISLEWLDSPGVTTPELAATWARYEIWVGGKCVTQVEERDGTFRRAVYGTVYPLAEWVAGNWWLLTGNLRPSATRSSHWTWANLDRYPWLRQHNFRGAGDGMSWPDLTVVPEGAISHLVWAADDEPTFGRVRFASRGSAHVASTTVSTALAGLVLRVLDRLADAGVGKTELAEQWSAIGQADNEEQEFCRAAARLGLDPYSVDEETEKKIISIVPSLPAALREDFLDNAFPADLTTAAEWVRDASRVAERSAEQTRRTLGELRAAIERETAANAQGLQPAWLLGYRMARVVRDTWVPRRTSLLE